MINYKNPRFVSALVISILLHIIIGSVLYVKFRPSPVPEANGERVNRKNETQSEATDIRAEYQDFILTPDKPGKRGKTKHAEKGISDSNIHTVKRGESYWLIARKYQISIEELLTHNELSTKHVLKVGDKLKIPNR